jgi:hypothetical protein
VAPFSLKFVHFLRDRLSRATLHRNRKPRPRARSLTITRPEPSWTPPRSLCRGPEPAVALVRLRAHAYATGRRATDVARDILDRRLRLEAN